MSSFRHRRRAPMKAAAHLEVRQLPTGSSPSTTASSASPTTFQQPTSAIPLTTTFTPPASCTNGVLTILPPPNYFIWENEPVPFENQTSTTCYPSQFLQAYTSVTSGGVGSSVVPAMSPLVCPENWCTMHANLALNNYVACCPRGFQFHSPEAPVDKSRPGYGGTCYSAYTVGQTYPAIAYNAAGESASQVYSATRTLDQAFAHPIDGFALSSPTNIGCSIPSSSPASNSTASAPPATAKKTSAGTIAGATVGGVIGLAALVGFIWFVLSYYRKHSRPPAPPPKIQHMRDGNMYAYEKDGDFTSVEIGTSARPPPVFGEKEKWRQSELNDGHGAFEMPVETIVELDATEKKRSSRVSQALNWKQRQ